jgi:hypothetical protein
MVATPSSVGNTLQEYLQSVYPSQLQQLQEQQLVSGAYASTIPQWETTTGSGWGILGTATSSATLGWSQCVNPIPQGKPPQKFNRINDVMLHPDGAPYEQPLDELRVKVAKWLRR